MSPGATSSGAVSPVAPGLLVMSYGTPRSPDEVEPYYTHIRRGNPPTPEQLTDLQSRYAAIGGLSPLAERTRDQTDALTVALETQAPGRWTVRHGARHAAPFIEDTVSSLAGDGVDALVGLVLAPHYSKMSVGAYHERARAAAAEAGLPYTPIDSWSDEPTWLDFQAEQVRLHLGHLPSPTEVLFTAHSLPERALVDDPYVDQLSASAAAVAERAGLHRDQWDLAWQSAGRTPEPWRGPDIADALRGLASSRSVAGVLVCPQGFVSDHLEILYDLDIDAHRVAHDLGLNFERTASLNDETTVMDALAHRVVRHLPDPG